MLLQPYFHPLIARTPSTRCHPHPSLSYVTLVTTAPRLDLGLECIFGVSYILCVFGGSRAPIGSSRGNARCVSSSRTRACARKVFVYFQARIRIRGRQRRGERTSSRPGSGGMHRSYPDAHARISVPTTQVPCPLGRHCALGRPCTPPHMHACLIQFRIIFFPIRRDIAHV